MFRGFVDGWWWPTINHLTNSFSLTLQEDVSILTHLRLVCFKVFKNIWILCTVEIETLFVVFCEWIWTWTVAAGKSCRVAASLEACLCAKLGFMGSDVRTCSSYFSPFSKQFDPLLILRQTLLQLFSAHLLPLMKLTSDCIDSSSMTDI